MDSSRNLLATREIDLGRNGKSTVVVVPVPGGRLRRPDFQVFGKLMGSKVSAEWAVLHYKC